MGFAPSWNSDFLYTATKLKGVRFSEKNGDKIIKKLDWWLENGLEFSG